MLPVKARAPNSPVIIVGTHRDKINKKFPSDYVEKIGNAIKNRYMVSEPDKKGLPRVMGHVEVSCTGGYSGNRSIRELSNLIWLVVSEEMLPGYIFVAVVFP